MKKTPSMRTVFPSLLLCLSWISVLQAEAPEGYYEPAYGQKSYALKTALFHIIEGHTSLSYAALWDAFQTTDCREDGYVWDMYSHCDFRFGSNQCGNYSREGDCYNREHSFPKSWFDDARPMYTDLFHLYPTDGYVNGRRSNDPFGEVEDPTWTSEAGCKLGPNSTPGYSGRVFEPLDEYKGDFARTYFYMATRYEDRIADWSSCPVCNGTSGQAYDDWVVDLLLAWHEQDPVSAKERDRNDAVYVYQGNRNPFIDYPELVEKIWGNDTTAFDPEGTEPDPGPDPDPEPDPDSLSSYRLVYCYADALDSVVFTDTLFLSAPVEVSGEGAMKIARDEVLHASRAKVGDTLINEGFSGMGGNESGAQAASVDLTDGYVESFEGSVFQSGASVRLASSSKSGAVVFKDVEASGSFFLQVGGKGWAEDELDFTVECPTCQPSSQTLSFTAYRPDAFQTLEPVVFEAEGSVSLIIRAQSNHRVFLDRVLLVALGDSVPPDPDPNPDPEPLPDTTRILSILYPVPGDTLAVDSVVAQVRLAGLPDTLSLNGIYALNPAYLADSMGYVFHVGLWYRDSCLQKDTVPFFFLGNPARDSLPGSGTDTLATRPLASRLDFKLYPNPSTGDVTLEIPASSRDAWVEIYTATGRLSLRKELGTMQVLKLQLLQPGLYLVRVGNARGVATRKLLVR